MWYSHCRTKQRGRGHINYILILVILSVAVYWDFKTFKIPNRLSYTGWGVGLSYSLMIYGIDGFLSSLVWILIPIAVLFLLFIFRFLGAGDIKLFSFIGSILFSDVLYIIVISMCLCGIYGIILLVIKLANKKLRRTYTVTHFSVFIILGTILYMVTGGCYGF